MREVALEGDLSRFDYVQSLREHGQLGAVDAGKQAALKHKVVETQYVK